MRSMLLCSVVLAVVLGSVAQAAKPPRVLFLTYSAGFKHAVVTRPPDGSLSLAEKQLQAAAQGHFEVVPTQDVHEVTREKLKAYKAVVFYTTGELEIDRDALVDYVKDGGGFAGVHSATDTLYKYAPYGEMVGGYFNDHPWHQKVRVKVEDTRHPATRHLGSSFEINDEIYQFKDWHRSAVHVLLSLDTSSVDLANPRVHRTDNDFALAWTRDEDKGRVFYTALGHEEQVWSDPRFLTHLVSGIAWTFGGK